MVVVTSGKLPVMPLRLSVDFPMSWGDLYDFVDAARNAGVPASDAVEEVVAEQDDSMVVGLRVELPQVGGRSATIAGGDRVTFAEALGSVIDSDGDARAVLGELKRLRDQLLGG